MHQAPQRELRPARGGPLRPMVWVGHLLLPILALWLLVAQPALDVGWEDHLAHFWLVLGAAVLNVWLAWRTGREARERVDARLLLVSLAFASAAAFFALHGLATPGVVLEGPNAGFEAATPVGLIVATAFIAASATEFTSDGAARVLRLRRVFALGLVVLVIAWVTVSLISGSPLAGPLSAQARRDGLLIMAAIGLAAYGYTAVRYYVLFRARRSVTLLSLITAFVLLAEAMVAAVFARNWQLSWWLWHVLLIAAFGFVVYSARVQARREGTPTGLFAAVALDSTVAAVRADLADALRTLVETVEQDVSGATPGDGVTQAAMAVGERFDLTERQVAVLEQGASALAHEREQLRRLAGLVELGQRASVARSEIELLSEADTVVARAFGRDRLRVGLLHDGALRFMAEASPEATDSLHSRALTTLEPAELNRESGSVLVLPLAVKGHPAGVLEVRRAHGTFADRDRWLLRSLATQLSIELENSRLYHQIEGLFRSYLSRDVATALLADPEQASLGGAVVEITALMADLRGFTTFTESRPPDEVVAMLNTYFSAAVPAILDEGGMVSGFVADAIVAVFNAPVRQPDHVQRACRAALAMQQACSTIAASRGWPRFRVGINTGPALVGNIGSEEQRHFTAIGDTPNVASRLEGLAGEGEVVIGPGSLEQLGDDALVEPLGEVSVKGKTDPVAAYRLLGMRD